MFDKNHYILQHNSDNSSFIKYEFCDNVVKGTISSLFFDENKKAIRSIDLTDNYIYNNKSYSSALFRLTTKCYLMEKYIDIKTNRVIESNLFLFDGKESKLIESFSSILFDFPEQISDLVLNCGIKLRKELINQKKEEMKNEIRMQFKKYGISEKILDYIVEQKIILKHNNNFYKY